MTSLVDEQRQEIRIAGDIGFWAVIALLVILAVHPFGTTELYDDGQRFLEHVNAFWVATHFFAALAFLAFPVAIAVWARHLETARARVIGQLGVYIGVVGTAVGMIHLITTDTTVFVMFSDTLAAGEGGEAVTVGADLLLRLHASTLIAWTISYFFAWPAVLGWAAKEDGRFPNWYSWLAWVAALLSAAAVSITMAEEQWTTLSEMGLFRPSATLLGLWLIVTTWWMRKGSVLGVPATSSG